METPLVTASTGVMTPLLSKVHKLLEEKYAINLEGERVPRVVGKQMRLLTHELGSMSPTLQMLADEEQLYPETGEWRDKLRELTYDLEDWVDTFMIGVDHQPEKHSGLWSISRQLHKLEVRHDEVWASKKHKRYPVGQLKPTSSSSSIDTRLQALHGDKLVGIDGPKKHIIELLTMEANNGSSTKLKVVPISGCGGLGKTTLAKQVYEDIKDQFKCAAFVSVSQTLHVRRILIHIADGVKCTEITQNDDEQQLIDRLKEHLNDKRYIIVIDDVWRIEDWGLIKLALPNNDLGSRIITTTRSVTVAKCCCSQFYEMEALSFDDSKRLFFRRAFGSDNSCYPQLEDVLEKILRKCCGLPLAVVTISGILTNEFAKAKWDRVLSAIGSEWDMALSAIGSALAKKHDAKIMTRILSLSYYDIPHHLRTCLLYLSVYPEDYDIEKQCLINKWIAEGFIHEEEGQTKYEIGEGYVNDLINRSMIQPINVKYGQAKAYQVHDIILKYIKGKAAEENFVTLLDAVEPVYTSKYKVRRLRVSNHNEENVTLWANEALSQVRSVTVFGQAVKFSLLPSTTLRVLDLGDCRGMEDHHLASIGNLINLKYLRLRSRSITKLPDNVGELQNLQTLDVQGTNIKELPRTITRLHQLAHLYVYSYARFPKGTIAKMHSLEELREYGVQSYEQGKSIEEFSKLTKLRTLKIMQDFELPDGSEGRNQTEVIHRYVGNLLSSCKLHDLNYTNNSMYPLALHSWHPAASCSIRKLCIEGIPVYRVPNWMGSLGNLAVLELEIMCLRPEDIEILGEIPSLLFLNLSTFGGTNGRIAVQGNNGFRSLKYFYLWIYLCGTSLEFEAGSMPKLEHVKLEFNAHEMECLNGASSLGIQHLFSLNKAEIKICSDRDGYDGNYNPVEDDHDDTVRFISRAINAATETIPNCPTATFKIIDGGDCKHFECALRELNQKEEGLFNEWLKLWQIREEQANQAVDGETELEDKTHKKEEEEQTDKEEETSEEEVAHQKDSGREHSLMSRCCFPLGECVSLFSCFKGL